MIGFREMTSLTIFLVDDHAVFREAIRSLLPLEEPKIRIVGEADTYRQTIAQVPKVAPDLILMDIVLRGTNGVATIRELRRLEYRGHVLALSAVSAPTFVTDAFAAGAQGYALKMEGVQELLRAIREVAAGRRYLAPALDDAVPGSDVDRAVSGPIGFGLLSSREREIFNLVVAGYGNRRMSAELFISIKTVETHRTRINRKLRVHSTGELIRLAALHGLLGS
jgi:DNA-binding NarL/FixJ family response regulator